MKLAKGVERPVYKPEDTAIVDRVLASWYADAYRSEGLSPAAGEKELLACRYRAIQRLFHQ